MNGMPEKKPRKKSNRRARTKYPALKRHLNLKTRYDLVDYDYVESLTEEEKEWLNRFTEEYVHANFKHEGKQLHKTKKMKKTCYDANNSRNRDIFTKSKAAGQLVFGLAEGEDADVSEEGDDNQD